jgi:Putative prokaryotic signal transducing protein
LFFGRFLSAYSAALSPLTGFYPRTNCLLYHPAIMVADESKRLAELYAAMNDGELENIAKNPNSLTDAAQIALATELRRRDLAPHTPEMPEGYEKAEYRGLVTIRKFRDLAEAFLAKGSLESAGIESFLADDNMVRIFVPTFTGGVRLQVRAEDATLAAEVLDEPNLEDFDLES